MGSNACLSQAAALLEGFVLNLGSPAVRMSTNGYHLLGHFHTPKQKVTVLRFPDDGKGISALKAGAPKKFKGTAGTLFKPGPWPERRPRVKACEGR